MGEKKKNGMKGGMEVGEKNGMKCEIEEWDDECVRRVGRRGGEKSAGCEQANQRHWEEPPSEDRDTDES